MPVLNKIKGRYEIKSVLGEGGMGVVYRAYDPPLKREVALKTLLEFNDQVSLQLFYKECEVLKSISHPNIVELFDMGEFDDRGIKKPFFVMPLLPGQPLDALILNSSQRLTVDRVVDIIAQACRGLQAAHDRGLIHRDLKPSNLFVMEDDSVKIIDFGVAHTVDARSRGTGYHKGTPLYMAPEQVEFRPVSTQSDIFSLGVVCYEALTRQQPFRRLSEDEVRNAIVRYIPPPVSEINPAVHHTISRVVHKAIAKQPWNRFDSAREFGETLKKALHNEPIELFDPSRTQPRIERATKALESGDFEFAGEIVGELEAEGNVDPRLTLLRARIDQVARQRTIGQLLESARARFEEEEDPLALQKVQEILRLEPNNLAALELKSKIEDRRNERQIEKWLLLARQHVENHAYSPAREAVENALQLRPGEPRALRLSADIQADEREYVRVRQQKAQAYQSALNSWNAGEISAALSQMELVLELDRQAPDPSSGDAGRAYQDFYNKVRSEHEAITNGYAQAEKALTDQDFATALKICEEFLAKYPNQALFQALQFEVQERQRQQLSAFIAKVDRKLDSESDLDAKINLLRDALATYPGEAHFERSLRIVSDKRDLVNSILVRARAHEEHSQISEAIADMETLRTIYSSYPGLQLELERLQKRREQQAQDAAKVRWVEQIERQLEGGNYPRAFELLREAQSDFPHDPELGRLEKLAIQGKERSIQAEQMAGRGLELCSQGQFEQGLETLRQAQIIDHRNSIVRAQLCDSLIEQARTLLEKDYRKADTLVAEALEIDPAHTSARSIRAHLLAHLREEAIDEFISRARRFQETGDLRSAAPVIAEALAKYPTEPRLLELRDIVNEQLAQQERSRIRDLEQARGLQQELATAAKDKLPSIYERSRGYARQHPRDPEVQSIVREIERIVRERGGAPPDLDSGGRKTPKPPPRHTGQIAELWQVFAKWKAIALFFRSRRASAWAGATALSLLVILLAWLLRPHPARNLPKIVMVPVQIGTAPPGATLRLNGEKRGTSELHTELEAGDYQLEAELPGYETEKKSFTAGLGSASKIFLTLRALPTPIRIVAPDFDRAQVWLDHEEIGNIVGGSLTEPSIGPGEHVLRIADSTNTREATVQLHTAPATMPSVSSDFETHQSQLITVSSVPGSTEVKSTLIDLPLSVDDRPSGQLSPDGLRIDNLQPGIHEVVVGRGGSARKMTFEVGPAPTLDVVVLSDRDVGSALVEVGEDDATVFVDGRAYPQKTQRGELHIFNLPTKPHTIRVRKEGFREPADWTIVVTKGHESRVRFTLEPLPKLAILALEHIPTGAQVQLDGTIIGTVGADGRFTRVDIPPGNHAVSVSAQGYPTRRVEHNFANGETVRISKEDLTWKRPEGTVNVIAPANVTFSIEQDGRTIRQLTGSQKLALEEGSYAIVAHGPSGPQAPVNVTVGVGEVNEVSLYSSVLGMEHFHPDQWVQQNGWHVHAGGLVLYDLPSCSGTFLFTLGLHFSHALFSHSSRIRWVLSYVNPDNYIEIQMDNKFLSRTDVIDGKKHDWPKQPHRIPADAPAAVISIEVSPRTVIQRYSLRSDQWETLYKWDDSDRPSLYPINGRNLTEGKFGFEVPEERSIEIANFRFIPH